MYLVYKLSFIITGTLLSRALFVSNDAFLPIVVISSLQFIYICFKYRDDFLRGISLFAFHLAVTYEIVFLINFTRILSGNYFFGIWLSQIVISEYARPNWSPTLIPFVLCILYQLGYYYYNYYVKAKIFTAGQLLRRASRMRHLMGLSARRSEKKAAKRGENVPSRIGKEIFIDTDRGMVRALAYNIGNPDKLPLYVNMHGGGFVLGSADTDDPFMARVAEAAGIKIFSLDYSLAPEFPFPKALDECYAIVGYLRQHPEKYGIDPERIAVGGQSAGGNLAAAICLIESGRSQPGISCAVLTYPPLDLCTDALEKPRPKGSLPVFVCRLFDACYHNSKAGRSNPLISPVFANAKQLSAFPPTLIITAGRDSLCEEAELFADMLRMAGVNVTERCFEDAAHGFNMQPGPNADESWQLVENFLKQHL